MPGARQRAVGTTPCPRTGIRVAEAAPATAAAALTDRCSPSFSTVMCPRSPSSGETTPASPLPARSSSSTRPSESALTPVPVAYGALAPPATRVRPIRASRSPVQRVQGRAIRLVAERSFAVVDRPRTPSPVRPPADRRPVIGRRPRQRLAEDAASGNEAGGGRPWRGREHGSPRHMAVRPFAMFLASALRT